MSETREKGNGAGGSGGVVEPLEIVIESEVTKIINKSEDGNMLKTLETNVLGITVDNIQHEKDTAMMETIKDTNITDAGNIDAKDIIIVEYIAKDAMKEVEVVT